MEDGHKIKMDKDVDKAIAISVLFIDNGMPLFMTSLPKAEKITRVLMEIPIQMPEIMSLWPLEVIMPCGEVILFMSRDDSPEETLMCPCGDDNHVVVDIGVE